MTAAQTAVKTDVCMWCGGAGDPFLTGQCRPCLKKFAERHAEAKREVTALTARRLLANWDGERYSDESEAKP